MARRLRAGHLRLEMPFAVDSARARSLSGAMCEPMECRRFAQLASAFAWKD
jgi:hypothetical protein